jgi:hypothetical protein
LWTPTQVVARSNNAAPKHKVGVPESVVMRMSGHRTRAVFDRYDIVEEDDLRDAVKRIEAGIAKNSGGSG